MKKINKTKKKKLDFRPFLQYLVPYKKKVIVTAIFALVGNLSFLLLPIFYGRMVDAVVTKKVFSPEIGWLLAAWLAVNLLGDWILRTKTHWVTKIAYDASSDLLIKSLEHLVNLPAPFHKSQRIGELIQRFSRASSYVYGLVERGTFEVVPALLSTFLAFAVILWIKWELALVYVVFIITYTILTIKKTQPVIENQRKLNKIFEKMYGDIFDRTPNILNIKSNAAEEFERQKNWENSQIGRNGMIMHTKLWMSMTVWQNLIFSGGFVTLFGLGIYYISVGAISVGQFVSLFAFVNMLSANINGLGGQYKNFQEGLVTIARANKIFDEVPEKYDDPNALEISDCQGALEFKNVTFAYDKENVLEKISFKAKAGSMVAIVGKSGEGKSTLVDLISRYIVPKKGKVLLDGVDTKKLKLKSLREQIAIVPQEINLFNDTIKNNIGYSRMGASEAEIIEAAKRAHCHEFIEKFPKKYAQVVGEHGVKLSVGQKQRVAIARAILRNPKILILDEATSALDSESEKYVQEALEKVMKNRTTFVIAHRLSTIRKADLILVIENGRIVESGDHQELINQGGVYKKLSELQQINV